MKILLLGGAGAMARVTLRDLLGSRGVEGVGLADLDLRRVEGVAQALGDERIVPMKADANDKKGLTALMKGWDVVINSTWYELNLKVMGAAIDAGIHYLDLGGLYHMTLKQLEMSREARDAGITCILGLGSSPGVTNLMAMHGSNMMSRVDAVRIRVAGSPAKSRDGFSPPYSFRTILDEATLPAAVLKNGKIEMIPGLSVVDEFALPDPVGKVEGYLTLHSELATLPKNLGKGIREMSFTVAFSPEFSRSLKLLVTLGLASKEETEVDGRRLVPYEVLSELVGRLPKAPTSPDDYGIRRVELWGEMEGRSSHLTYDCESGPHRVWGIGGRALGTGVPASLGAQWAASGRVGGPGVFPPELSIDPGRFLRELGENGRGIVTYLDDGSQRVPV